MRKFRGRFKDLQELVAATGISGEWVESRQQTQYRTDSGAIVNYWESTGTVNFQGSPDPAAELEAAMFPANRGSTGAGSSQPNTGRATVNDADLQFLTRSIIKNRVGPIFDNESAFVAKVARQCMADLCEKLGLFVDAKESVGTSPQTRRSLWIMALQKATDDLDNTELWQARWPNPTPSRPVRPELVLLGGRRTRVRRSAEI